MNTPHRGALSPRVRLRRSPLWLLAGIVLACLGGLASAFLYEAATASDPVLRVNRTIHRGEVIAAADLSVVSLARGVDLRAVPGSQLNHVVGKAAATDLPGGGLLVEGSWGESGLAGDQTRVGVRLSAGRFPAADLRPGTPVLVVALAGPQAGVGGTAEALPASVAATLVAPPADQPDGSFTVDVTVPAAQAEQVARLAAADRVALVQVGSTR